MNKCGHLPVLCVLLLSFHGVLCSEFARKYVQFPDEISNGDLFKSVWRNSKQRRSVRFKGIGLFSAAEQTPATKPQYECGDRVLTVVLQYAQFSNIRVYGPRGDKLHLSHLSAFCGVSIKPTNTDIRLSFTYDSCYVKQESSKRVLSLSWYGTDLDLTCPVSVTPFSKICKNKAMELTVVDGTADKLSVALNEEWAPLFYVATECWKRELSNQGVLTFSVPYTSCGVTVGEGNYNVNLRLKDKMITLSCPYERTLLPVMDSRLSETNQPLPQQEPDLYQNPPSGFPKNAMASQVVKKEQAFPVEATARNTARTPTPLRRNSMLPKLPSLPGSFNLAVNFPFSLPMSYQHAPRDHLPGKPVPLSPEPTSALTPVPTDSSSEFSSSVQNPQPPVSYEQRQEETAAPVTEAPKSEYQYLRYLDKLERPASTPPQTKPSPAAQEYQVLRGTFSSASLYRPDGSHQNFPKPNPLQVNPALANLAQLIPPGYFLCSYDDQQPPIHPHKFHPHKFQPPAPNQPLQYQKPDYQKPDIAPLAPVDPPVPPMKGYLQQQLLLPGGVASSPYDTGTPLFQPAPYFQTSPYQQQLYPSGSGPQGSATPLLPTSPFKPINLQTETRPYPTFYDSRPLQPQYHQRHNRHHHGSVQQPWSTSPFLVKGLTQESRPFMPASSQTPGYPQYQTGGGPSLDSYRRSVFSAPVNRISSPSQYMPSQLSTFPYSFRPEKPSADVFAENTRSSPEGFVQPRSKSSVLIPRGTNKGNRPKITMHHPSQGKGKAQVSHSLGPSVRYIKNHRVHPERPVAARSQATNSSGSQASQRMYAPPTVSYPE